jgi:carbon storage regulator CsrA
MLVLTRKAKQQIRIGDDVVITIVRIKGQSVRVGVEAPRHVRVARAELPKLTPEILEIAPGKPVEARTTTPSHEAVDGEALSRHRAGRGPCGALSERVAIRSRRSLEGSSEAGGHEEGRIGFGSVVCLRS